MIRTKKFLIIALMLPIVVLLALITYKKYILYSGQEVILSISGYDPRDLLSGHYLTYTINYPVNNICSGATYKQNGYICLEPKKFSFAPLLGCKVLIRGVCNYGRLEAGIERYYVPENKAMYLEKQVREKTAYIVISVMPDGQAQVKDLWMNGRSWKKE